MAQGNDDVVDAARATADIRVSLDIHGFNCPADEITELLGVSPTRVWRRGDSVPNSTLVRKENHWILDAPGLGRESIQDQLKALMNLTRTAQPRFRNLPPDATKQIYCAVYDYYRTVVLGFSVQFIQQIAALGADLNIDYYDLTPHEETN